MKINAINNTNFRGLFTDKSSQNGGNWKMEYSPYAWESPNGYNLSKMDTQRDIDIFGTVLPDNEKIYTENYNRKSAKDILGTEFYYETYDGRVRKTITEVPAMNREDSLRVYNSKLQKFLEMKSNKLASIAQAILDIPNGFTEMCSKFNERARDIKQGYFARSYTLEGSSNEMTTQFDNMTRSANKAVDEFKQYKSMRESMDFVKKYIAENDKEIELLSEKRNAGKLIDISKRDAYDPNKKLWQALQNIKEAVDKYVSLPHKTISVQEILNNIGKDIKKADIPKVAIEYVDYLVSNRL